MPEPRIFSPPQAARLKSRLIAYRAIASRSSRPLSLFQLIHEISDSPAAMPWLREADDVAGDAGWDWDAEGPSRAERADKGAPMTTNVLQKWFSGELVTRGRGPARIRIRHFTTPSPGNLMAIYAFLKEKSFIAEGDLAEERWEHAVLASAFREFTRGGSTASAGESAAPLTGEYFSAFPLGADVVIRRLTLTETGLDEILTGEERVMIFAAKPIASAPSTALIDITRPRAVAVLPGWAVFRDAALAIFTAGTLDGAPLWNEHRLLAAPPPGDDAALDLASLAGRPGQAAVISREQATRDPSAFLDHAMALLRKHAARIHGPPIKLLRPARLPETEAETFSMLAGCFSFGAPYRFDAGRFALLCSLVPHINARHPATGETILHHAARTLNRDAIKALMKRADLDVLVQDGAGCFPSRRALETDSSSAIGHFLLRREVAAARARGFDYARAITAAYHRTEF